MDYVEFQLGGEEEQTFPKRENVATLEKEMYMQMDCVCVFVFPVKWMVLLHSLLSP
jgi:hypothetical protein